VLKKSGAREKQVPTGQGLFPESRFMIGVLAERYSTQTSQRDPPRTFSSLLIVSEHKDRACGQSWSDSERERPFRAASGATEFATAAHLADADPGSDARYLP
jgi:hypothetical protein